MTAAIDCDKGPVLDQISNQIIDLKGLYRESQKEQRESQRTIAAALTEIARGQERIIALTDKTESSLKNINTLFSQQRDFDRRLTNHILAEGHTVKGQPDALSVLRTQAGNWTKLQYAVITAAVLGAGSFFWNLFLSLSRTGVLKP